MEVHCVLHFIASSISPTEAYIYIFATWMAAGNTRWFKYDRYCLHLFTHTSVPVIFEPPCILILLHRVAVKLHFFHFGKNLRREWDLRCSRQWMWIGMSSGMSATRRHILENNKHFVVVMFGNMVLRRILLRKTNEVTWHLRSLYN